MPGRIANRARFLALSATALILISCSRPVDQTLETLHIPDDISGFQKEILADGTVTFEEYERSMLAEIACLEEEAGIVVDGPVAYGRFLTYSYTVEGIEQGESVEEIEQACGLEYRAYVEPQWEVDSRPSETERLELMSELVTCVRQVDPSVPDNPTPEQLNALGVENPGSREQLADCIDLYGDAFAGG